MTDVIHRRYYKILANEGPDQRNVAKGATDILIKHQYRCLQILKWYLLLTPLPTSSLNFQPILHQHLTIHLTSATPHHPSHLNDTAVSRIFQNFFFFLLWHHFNVFPLNQNLPRPMLHLAWHRFYRFQGLQIGHKTKFKTVYIIFFQVVIAWWVFCYLACNHYSTKIEYLWCDLSFLHVINYTNVSYACFTSVSFFSKPPGRRQCFVSLDLLGLLMNLLCLFVKEFHYPPACTHPAPAPTHIHLHTYSYIPFTCTFAKTQWTMCHKFYKFLF